MFYALSTFALALSVPLACHAQDTDPAAVIAEMEKAKIIPDVIANFTPAFPLAVVFTANSSTFPVTAGANLTKAQTANIPSFAIVSNDTAIIGKPYLLAIIDPDAPTPQDRNQSEFRNFLGADYISDNDTNGEFILTNHSKTATLTDYAPPNPPDGSDPHRFVVLCYLQNSTGVTPPSDFDAANRANFNITQFVNSIPGNNMTLLGATFFFVSPNDTTGSVAPNSSKTRPVSTAPASSPTSAIRDSEGLKLGVTVTWILVGAFSAAGALLL